MNLWKQPANAVEALATARTLLTGSIPDITEDAICRRMKIGETSVGEAFQMDWRSLGTASWGVGGAFAQTELVRCLWHLQTGQLYLPGRGVVANIDLKPLRSVARLGFDCRDMHDGFELSDTATEFPTFWNHDSGRVTCMTQTNNRWLRPLEVAKPGRPRRDASALWKKAGKVLIAERLRLNTMRMAAIRVRVKVLSNVWWTLRIVSSELSGNKEKALVLWLNSTPGLLLMFGSRQETCGAWVKFKKPSLLDMCVLNMDAVGELELETLAGGYDRLSTEDLDTCDKFDTDPIRRQIDETIASALDLPDMGVLRDLLAREPLVRLDMAGIAP